MEPAASWFLGPWSIAEPHQLCLWPVSFGLFPYPVSLTLTYFEANPRHQFVNILALRLIFVVISQFSSIWPVGLRGSYCSLWQTFLA